MTGRDFDCLVGLAHRFLEIAQDMKARHDSGDDRLLPDDLIPIKLAAGELAVTEKVLRANARKLGVEILKVCGRDRISRAALRHFVRSA